MRSWNGDLANISSNVVGPWLGAVPFEGELAKLANIDGSDVVEASSRCESSSVFSRGGAGPPLKKQKQTIKTQ